MKIKKNVNNSNLYLPLKNKKAEMLRYGTS